MNQNLIEAMTSIERAKALLFAYEKVFLDLNVEPECQELAGMAISRSEERRVRERVFITV